MQGKEDSEINEALGPDLSPDQPDVKLRLRPTNTEFTTIFEWFTDPHSRDLYSRQILAVEKFCKKFAEGFFLADLTQIQKLLEVLVSKFPLHSPFSSPIISVLKSCAIPYAVESTSDLWNYKQTLISLISFIGNMLLLDLPNSVLLQIVKTLHQQILEGQLTPEEEHMLPQHCVHQTDVAGVISRALSKLVSSTSGRERTKEETEFLLQLINTNKELSFYKIHVERINLPATLKNLLLVSRSLDSEAQETITDILLQTIQLSLHSETFLSNLDYSQLLTYCIPCVEQSESTAGTNDVLLVALQVSKIKQSWNYFVTTGVLSRILSKLLEELTKQENQIAEPRIERVHIFLLILTAILASKECLSTIVTSGILKTLLLYIDLSFQFTAISKWKPNQISDLRSRILSLLFHLAPRCVPEFLESEGIPTLLKWIKPGSADNMKSGLAVLLACISQLTMEQIEQQEATVEFIKDVLSQQLQDSISSDMISAISMLCISERNRDTFVRENGVLLLAVYIKNYRQRYVEQAPNSELYITSILDCIWVCLKKSERIKEFIEEEGIETIVDLLEDRQNTALQNQILNFLVDIATDNVNILDNLKKWRSQQTNRSISSLLIKLWTDEEKRLGIQSSDILTEERRPLGQSTVKSLNHDFSTTDMRRSIYSLFKLLNFVASSGLTAREKSKLHLVHFSCAVLIQKIKHFLDFRVAEIWGEIYQELLDESIIPVRLDQKAIDGVLNKSSGLAKQVQEHQLKIIQEQRKLDLQEEQRFYDALRYHTQVRQKVEMTSVLTSRTAK